MTTARASWHWIFAAVAMSSTWALLGQVSEQERPVSTRPLARLPLEIAESWTGEELALPAPQLEVLQATDVLLRNYRALPSAGSLPHLNEPSAVLFVAYFGSQRTGVTYHSPRHCLPGSGWQITDLQRIALPGPYGHQVTVNEAVIQNGLERQVMLYWFQDRGRVVASEYAAKAYLVWDALTTQRSDGAIVRVTVAVAEDVEDARDRARQFVGDVWRPLSDLLAEEGQLAPLGGALPHGGGADG